MNAPAARIAGGTGSCSRRPMKARPTESWKCGCGQHHPPHMRNCPDTFRLGGPGPSFRRPDLR